MIFGGIGLAFFVLGMFIHEYSHLVAFRKFGFNSKIIITKWFHMPTLGMKLTGLKDNFVHAKIAEKVLFAPIFPGVVINTIGFIFVWGKLSFNYIAFAFLMGELMTLAGSGSDLFKLFKIMKWWHKPKENLVKG